jgi:hypothetical protein
MYVIGIDPGPITGIVQLQLGEQRPRNLLDVQVLQATPGVVTCVLAALTQDDHAAIALERFVVGPRAARSSTPAAGLATRSLIGEVEGWARDGHLRIITRSAADVKPWATAARLAAAGLIEPTAGMRHARDASRHALFCAVRDYGLPDPLSKGSHWGNGVGGVGLAQHPGHSAGCPAPECGA